MVFPEMRVRGFMDTGESLAVPELPDVAQVQRILCEALGRGAAYADVFIEHRVASSIAYEDHHVRTASRGVTGGVGIRVVHGDQTGFAYADSFELEPALRAARTAAAIAQASPSSPYPFRDGLGFVDRYPVARPSVFTDVRERVRLLERMSAAAHRADPRVIRCSIILNEDFRQIRFYSSEGVWFRDQLPLLRFDITAIAEQNGHRHSITFGGGGRLGLEYFQERTPETLGARAATQVVGLFEAIDAPAGPSEVVLAAADSGILLHEAVGHGLEADFNSKNLSNFSNRVGERVASPLCTIVDSGTFPHMRGTVNVDDEGNLPRENVLIESGVLRGYLHDRISARTFKVAPTGNGRRESYCHRPMPRMTNTYMLPGIHDPEEIIRSVKKGIFARRFGGGQVDITKGDFVFSLLECYLIEDGKLTAPLRNVSLVGNGPQVMNRVTMVGNDLEFSDGTWTCGKHGQRVPVGVGQPTIKISEIVVGGTQARHG